MFSIVFFSSSVSKLASSLHYRVMKSPSFGSRQIRTIIILGKNNPPTMLYYKERRRVFFIFLKRMKCDKSRYFHKALSLPPIQWRFFPLYITFFQKPKFTSNEMRYEPCIRNQMFTIGNELAVAVALQYDFLLKAA